MDVQTSDISREAHALAKIVCGACTGNNETDATLRHLQDSVRLFANHSSRYLKGDFDENSQLYSAFVARALLENSVAAILGRLDPFRLLYLRTFQSGPNFEYGKPAKYGFRWQGDVLASKAAPQEMWSTEHDESKINRALFSDYFDALFWKPAIESVLDQFTISGIRPPTLASSLELSAIIPSFRRRFATLYSTLSKGVHWEFFVDSIVIDEPTLKDCLQDTFLYLSEIALISHFVPSAHASFDPAEALEIYELLRTEIE